MIRVYGFIIDGSSAQVGMPYIFLSDDFTDLRIAVAVSGDDRGLLEREIVVIQELLDEQPDSKCEFSVSYDHMRSCSLTDGTPCRLARQGAWSRLFITSNFYFEIIRRP